MKDLLQKIMGKTNKPKNSDVKKSKKSKLAHLALTVGIIAVVFPISKSKDGIVKALDSVQLYVNAAAILILSYGLFIGFKRVMALRKLNSELPLRVWLDDERIVPEGFTHWVKTAQDAIKLLETGRVSHISLDHDLGDENLVGTGYVVACWIEEKAYEGKLKKLTWNVHSANPTGRDKMRAALNNAEGFWAKQD